MISYPLGRASPIAAVGLLLAGCGGSSQSQATIPLASSSVRQTGQHDKSWMLPEAKSKDLLYVARNSPGEISVYTYPKGKPVGAITGISGQSGICSDIMGNVFVVSVESQQIYEYAHGGKEPIATLDDSGNYPNGCAVDPTFNNLAVAGGDGGVPANVAIFTDEQGIPAVYTEGSAAAFNNCTYDGDGNLYTAGETIFELPAGGSSFNSITPEGIQVGGAPGIQWDGKYIALPGQSTRRRKGPAIIYQIQIAGSSGTVINTITLTNRSNNNPFRGAQFWISEGTIVMPEAPNRNVGLWHYPQGGGRVHSRVYFEPTRSVAYALAV